MASKNRKTIIFSNKNTDLYEHLVKMQERGNNVSEYLCNLIRADLEMTISKNDFSNLNDKLNELDRLSNIELMLSDLIKNGVAINRTNQQEDEKDEVKVELVSVSDEDLELVDDEDADDLFDMFGDMFNEADSGGCE